MKKLKAFTLIEMLIVIVIIGILAAALIPRLSKARGRANDTARKADLSQIAASLVSYQIDKGKYPVWSGDLSDIYDDLQVAWLDTLPTDPAWSKVSIIWDWSNEPGQYAYASIKKNNQDGWWFIVMAVAETEGWANYVVCLDSNWDIEANHDSLTTITNTTSFADITKCSSFDSDADCGTITADNVCWYDEWEWELRYIYMQ